MYYQIFATDGVLSSKQPFSDSDPTIGRAVAQHIAPPRNPPRIKEHIAKIERTPELVSAEFYPDLDFDRVEDSFKIRIGERDGPGSSPDRPVALVLLPNTSAIITQVTPSTGDAVRVPASVYVDHRELPWFGSSPVPAHASLEGWKKAKRRGPSGK